MAHAINAYQIRRVPGSSCPRIAWFDLFRLIIPRRLKGKRCFPKLAPTLGREQLLEIVAFVYIGTSIQLA